MLILLGGLPTCGEDCMVVNPLGNLVSISGKYVEVLEVFPDGKLFVDNLDPAQTHSFQTIGIFASFDVELLALGRPLDLGFASRALACDGSFAIIQDTISHISITSELDYDDSHPAGESLNDIFVMTTFNAIPQSFEMIAQPLTIENYLLLQRPATHLFSFLLIAPPATSRFRGFKLEIELRNGKRFELDLPRIFIIS